MKKFAVNLIMIFIVILGLNVNVTAQTRVYPDLLVEISPMVPGTDSVSDYSIHFKYDKRGEVNCRWYTRHDLHITEDGDDKIIYNDEANGEYATLNLELPVGPESNHRYGLRYREKSYKVYSCDEYSWSGYKLNEAGKWEPYATPSMTERDNLYAVGKYRVTFQAVTAPIKSPRNVNASNQVFFDKIVLNWTKGTNIPDSFVTYRIYRDTTTNPATAQYLAEVAGSIRTWTDTTAVPNDVFYYWVTTYTTKYPNTSNNTNIHESTRSTSNAVQGSAKTIMVQASDGSWSNKVRVDWGDLSSYFKNIKVERSIPNSSGRSQVGITLGPLETGSDDSDPVPGCDYTYYVTPIHAPRTFPAYTDKGYRKLNGEISGRVTSSHGAGVDNVRVSARLLTAIPPGAVALPSGGYCAYTDVNGYYTIPDIYYYDRAEFYITPYKKGQILVHDFSPDSTRITLSASSPTKTVDFTDVSVFTVGGKVLYPISSTQKECGIPGVEILKDGEKTGLFTNQNGEWGFSIQNEGTYSFKPVFKHHLFINAQGQPETQVTVNDNVTNINFTDTQVDSIKVRVQSGCGTSLASNKAIVQVTSPNVCFNRTYNTDANGLLTIRDLPARIYELQVVGLDPPNSNYMNQIGNKPITVDLTVRDTAEVIENGATTRVAVQPKAEFIYHSAMEVTVDWAEGGAEVVCDTTVLMEQDKSYKLYFNVKESLGNCLVTEGVLRIYDYVSDRKDSVDVQINNGVAIYTVIPGIPKITSDRGHKKQLYVLPRIGFLQSPPQSFWILETGVKTNDAAFVTKSPEIPSLILHDPPGDSSYCYVSKGRSYKNFTRHEILKGGEGGAYGDVILGVSSGVESWGVHAKFEITGGKDTINRHGVETNITFEERFETDFTQDFIGGEGDVFIGASYNEEFSLADELTFDKETCSPKLSVIPALRITGFNTTFIYSEKHIRHTLIPNYIRLYDAVLAGRDTSELSVSEKAQAEELLLQRTNWEGILATNALNRGEKATPVKNISFSAGTVYTNELTTDTLREGSFEFRQLFNTTFSLGVKMKHDVFFWKDIDAGVVGKYRISNNVHTGGDSTYTRKVGYVLTDRDEGDYFSVDIKRDEMFGVPAFQLISGASSCPYEPGTQHRDYPEIIITPPEINNIPIGGTANFVAKLTNYSQSGQTRDYAVKVITNTNPDGAIVKLGGSIINNAAVPYRLDFNQTANIALTVEKGPYATSYKSIGIVMYAPCRWESATSDTAWINVDFQKECSAVWLSSPGNGWLVNQSSNDILNVAFTGYDYNDPKLQSITLQYKKEGGEWADDITIYKADLVEAFYDYPFNVSRLTDGSYRLRLKSYCGAESALSYSPELSGNIDRVSVAPFGYPSPSDGILRTGQVISVEFDKNISCDLSATDIKLMTADGTEIPFTPQCNGKSIALMPQVNLFDGSVWRGVVFSATVQGVRDLSGNIQKYPVTWSFQVDLPPTGNPNICPVPGIQCPDDIAMPSEPGFCGAQVFFPDVTHSPDCGGPGITLKQTGGLLSGYFFPVGVTTNTYVLTNDEGKTATCGFDVTVYDNEPPVIRDLSAELYPIWPPDRNRIPVELKYTASDNCGIQDIEIFAMGSYRVNNTSTRKTPVPIVRIDQHHILLVAERSGPGAGREYTIFIRCRDQGGFYTQEKTTIFVPNENTILKSTGSADQTGLSPDISAIKPALFAGNTGNEPFMASVWPNPTKKNFNIEVISSNNEKVEVSVLDILGRMISTVDVNGSQPVPFGESLVPGVYFISVRQGIYLKNFKVIKQ